MDALIELHSYAIVTAKQSSMNVGLLEQQDISFKKDTFEIY